MHNYLAFVIHPKYDYVGTFVVKYTIYVLTLNMTIVNMIDDGLLLQNGAN